MWRVAGVKGQPLRLLVFGGQPPDEPQLLTMFAVGTMLEVCCGCVHKCTYIAGHYFTTHIHPLSHSHSQTGCHHQRPRPPILPPPPPPIPHRHHPSIPTLVWYHRWDCPCGGARRSTGSRPPPRGPGPHRRGPAHAARPRTVGPPSPGTPLSVPGPPHSSMLVIHTRTSGCLTIRADCGRPKATRRGPCGQGGPCGVEGGPCRVTDRGCLGGRDPRGGGGAVGVAPVLDGAWGWEGACVGCGSGCSTAGRHG